MPTKHKWNREARREDVMGKEQDVKDCTACGMSRTRDCQKKAMFIFRRRGAPQWRSYAVGYIPDCVPVQEGK